MLLGLRGQYSRNGSARPTEVKLEWLIGLARRVGRDPVVQRAIVRALLVALVALLAYLGVEAEYLLAPLP